MRFIKVIFASLLVILGIIFIVENRVVLETAVQLKLDLYLVTFQTPHMPLWLLVLFSFFLGIFTASLYGMYEILSQRKMIRQLRQNVEILGAELKRAGAAEESEPTAAEAASSSSS